REVASRLPWPENVWMGVSVENDRYTFRARHLVDVPAAVRFLSCEPLIGPLPSLDVTGLDWVIVGGESGTNSRPLSLDWVRQIRDLCAERSVAFFVKQLGTRWAVAESGARTHGGAIDDWPVDVRVREMPERSLALT